MTSGSNGGQRDLVASRCGNHCDEHFDGGGRGDATATVDDNNDNMGGCTTGALRHRRMAPEILVAIRPPSDVIFVARRGIANGYARENGPD